MVEFLNLGSLFLGISAWLVPVFAISLSHKIKNKVMIPMISFSACSLSLVLQIFEINRNVGREDWSSLMDIVPSLSWIVAVLVLVTILLNVLWLINDSNKKT